MKIEEIKDQPVRMSIGNANINHLEFAKNELKHRKPIKALGHLVQAVVAYFRK